MIVRFGLEALPALLEELGVGRPALVASPRAAGAIRLPLVGRWSEIPSDRIEPPAEADCLIAVGGGSAIDTAKAPSAAHALPLVSVPTTYSGAEWAPTFGVRSPDRRLRGSGGGARLAGIVYEVELTLGLPLSLTVGTAMNALAHCAEALYTPRRSAESDARALEGAALIARHLPAVVASPRDRDERTGLLLGAAAAGEALALAGLALAHALAQTLGGSYGLPHGAMNALTLAPTLRFNAPAAAEALSRFGAAIGAPADPAARVEELAALGGFGRLRDHGIPAGELEALARLAAERPGAAANPRPASPAQILELLRAIH